MRTHTESLTGQINRVLADTVQHIMDGDNILSTLGRAFNGSAATLAGPTVNEPSFTRNVGQHDEITRLRVQDQLNPLVQLPWKKIN
jgi:hypothetical protein